VCISPFPIQATCSAHLILLDLTTRFFFGGNRIYTDKEGIKREKLQKRAYEEIVHEKLKKVTVFFSVDSLEACMGCGVKAWP